MTGPQIPAGVAPRITPTRDFYTISKNFLDPLVRAESWELTIVGLVEHPRTLRYGDLRQLPAASQPTTLTCISNEVGGALIGTAIWTGVPLAALLTRTRACAKRPRTSFSAAKMATWRRSHSQRRSIRRRCWSTR
ncbi:MAG: molybdopterin-dependent oxidoreductase [Thermomicrobiales bacterium]